MKTKTIFAACAVPAAAFGVLVVPAEAQPYRHGYRHHGYHHQGYRHHYRHHRHDGIIGNVVRGVARSL